MKKDIGALCVRFMSEDLRSINKASKKVGIWSSTWVRKIVLQHLEGMGERTSEIKLEERSR
jgi:hypothetical protein